MKCLRNKQASQPITFTLTWGRMCIRWRNSMTKFDDEKKQWRKSVTNIQWDLRLLGTYDDIFGTLIIRQRCSAYWVHLWLQSFGPLGCSNHILHCVLASQKHPWRIVVARKFEVFRVFDVQCVVCMNCIQTAWVCSQNVAKQFQLTL